MTHGDTEPTVPRHPRNLADSIWTTKLKRKKGNLAENLCICSGHFEEDCFDLSWKIQSSTSVYANRPIQRVLIPGSIPTKFPHNPESMKERSSSKIRAKRRKQKEVKRQFISS